MKKISKRAWMALALAFALLAGLLVFFGEYFIEAHFPAARMCIRA